MRLLPFFSLWLVGVSFFLAWADPKYLALSIVLLIFVLFFTLVDPFRHAGWVAATIANLIYGYILISQKGGSTLILSLVVIVEALFFITVWFGNSTRANLVSSRKFRKVHSFPNFPNKRRTLHGKTISPSSFSTAARQPGEVIVAFMGMGMDMDMIDTVREALCKKYKSEKVRLLYFTEDVTAFAVLAEINALTHDLLQLEEISVKRVMENNDWIEVDLI